MQSLTRTRGRAAFFLAAAVSRQVDHVEVGQRRLACLRAEDAGQAKRKSVASSDSSATPCRAMLPPPLRLIKVIPPDSTRVCGLGNPSPRTWSLSDRPRRRLLYCRITGLSGPATSAHNTARSNGTRLHQLPAPDRRVCLCLGVARRRSGVQRPRRGPADHEQHGAVGTSSARRSRPRLRAKRPDYAPSRSGNAKLGARALVPDLSGLPSVLSQPTPPLACVWRLCGSPPIPREIDSSSSHYVSYQASVHVGQRSGMGALSRPAAFDPMLPFFLVVTSA
jgi:hypothetical protein